VNIIFVILILSAGIFGAWFHFLQVQKRADVSSFFEYLFVNNTAGSKSALFAFVAAMQAAYLGGAFNGLEMDAVIKAAQALTIYPPLFTVLYTAFGIGYTCDSALNSWDPSEVQPDPKAQAAQVAASEPTQP
jgi:Na+/pantothenate symporter